MSNLILQSSRAKQPKGTIGSATIPHIREQFDRCLLLSDMASPHKQDIALLATGIVVAHVEIIFGFLRDRNVIYTKVPFSMSLGRRPNSPGNTSPVQVAAFAVTNSLLQSNARHRRLSPNPPKNDSICILASVMIKHLLQISIPY
jgi:hypothetical protein